MLTRPNCSCLSLSLGGFTNGDEDSTVHTCGVGHSVF